MQTGELDQIIFLETLVETNVSGEVESAWTDGGREFAKIISQRGDESFEAARTQENALIKVKLRYRSDLNGKMRFTWNDQLYYIKHVDESLRREGELWLMASLEDS